MSGNNTLRNEEPIGPPLVQGTHTLLKSHGQVKSFGKRGHRAKKNQGMGLVID
jgi:hypothetical protein